MAIFFHCCLDLLVTCLPDIWVSYTSHVCLCGTLDSLYYLKDFIFWSPCLDLSDNDSKWKKAADM